MESQKKICLEINVFCPEHCTANELIDFFAKAIYPPNVIVGVGGAQLINNSDVTLQPKIASRVFRLYKQSKARVIQATRILFRTNRRRSEQIEEIPLLQQPTTSAPVKRWIRLCGLPYEAGMEHILQFLENVPPNCFYLLHAGQDPYGGAFIELCSEEAAHASTQLKHDKLMIFKEIPYMISVYQCSRDDMDLVLNRRDGRL